MAKTIVKPNGSEARAGRLEDDRTGMSVETLKHAFTDHLRYTLGKDDESATPLDRYLALAYTIRDRIMRRWFRSQETYYEKDAKRVYYLSAEFLMGRYTMNNIINVELEGKLPEAIKALGMDMDVLLDCEPDAGLGNGGLGRLAACFLDSMAALRLPAYGYGIRYEFGIFEQQIRNGFQVEQPDRWLQYGNPWEIVRPERVTPIYFGGRTEGYTDEHGAHRVRWIPAMSVLAVPYDTPIDGYDNDNANTLRLWAARATKEFDFREFDEGDYLRAVEQKNLSENISKVLYPNDNSVQGRELRLKQQFFFVSASLQDIIRRYVKVHQTFGALSSKVAIQLNDTHPSVAVAELMRLLVDQYKVPWDEAWEQTVAIMGYTNHTLLAEALETWPVDLFGSLLPRHLEIIYEINRRFLEQVKTRFPGDDARVQRMSIIGEHPNKHVRMAHLATVGAHSINGVAALHTELLKRDVLGDFYQMWPERFNNKTNGVTPRRWLLMANPRLADEITRRIGDGWAGDLDRLQKLAPLADDPSFRQALRQIKEANKADFARYIKGTVDVDVDPHSMFDVQIKRLHEYKRQHLNVLHVLARYLRLKRNPSLDVVPRTFIYSGKAAPGYFLAKLIIKLITATAKLVNNDRDVAGRYKVVFLPNYRVSMAEKIFPASDLSEQISTAGKEASGTGNMKFALNGALTIGTLDGANVEIREQVGADNFFLFGLRAEEVLGLTAHGYDPLEPVRNSEELRGVIDLIGSGALSPEDPGLFKPLLDNLLGRDPYLVLRDFDAYVRCQEEVDKAWRDVDGWYRKSAINIAKMGFFSSDRTIRQYAEEIWQIKPVEVVLDKKNTFGP
ncbi:MAG: glycogen/starch/alpha-glucan phosphorylase [Armatimonadetes bacterium]|nr:glycogen/starch/alpha-glucan phosphorylase [Armatimonadota bacterium]